MMSLCVLVALPSEPDSVNTKSENWAEFRENNSEELVSDGRVPVESVCKLMRWVSGASH